MTRNRRLRVGVLRERWLPLSESFVSDQAEALATHVDCVPVCVAPDPEVDAARQARAGVRSWTGSTGRTAQVATFVGRSTGRLPGAGRRWRLDELDAGLVHFGPDAAFFAPFLRRAGVPFAVVLHGYDMTLTDAALATTSRATRAWLDRRTAVFAEAAVLLAVSEFIAGRLLAAGAPAEKVKVQYLGVEPPSAPPVPLHDRTGIAFVGRLVHKKGAVDLLSALAGLPGPLRRTPVQMIGDGPLRASLESLAVAEGLDVTFHGARPHPEALEAMRRARVFCVPSRTAPNGDAEGLGLVFLEAAARGTPVVSYRHGGVPEAVLDGTTGLLAPESDVPGLGERLATLLTDDDLWAAMSTVGVTHVRQRFDRSALTAQLVGLLGGLPTRGNVG